MIFPHAKKSEFPRPNSVSMAAKVPIPLGKQKVLLPDCDIPNPVQFNLRKPWFLAKATGDSQNLQDKPPLSTWACGASVLANLIFRPRSRRRKSQPQGKRRPRWSFHNIFRLPRALSIPSPGGASIHSRTRESRAMERGRRGRRSCRHSATTTECPAPRQKSTPRESPARRRSCPR